MSSIFKRIAIPLFFFLFLLCCVLLGHFLAGPSDWFVFDLKNNLKGSLSLDRSIFDAPAGKHGFLTVQDGHFYFQDGTPVRFWGTNLCFSANFPSKRQARVLADRIAFLGFNVVRLHHMDSRFEPDGIFRDSCRWCKDPQKKQSGLLSQRQLDRLDYFIDQLKKRGIYIDINLLVARRFTLADGVRDAGLLMKAAKPASLFDPKLIALQKEFARELLTHYNRYTRLAYRDDPAIALVEITNENSIFLLEKNMVPLPAFYLRELIRRWRAFPKEGYMPSEETRKAFFVHLEKTYIDEMITFLKKECGVRVPVTGIAGYNQKETLDASLNADFVDTHAYWDHPRFPGFRWDETDFRMTGKSILRNNDLGIMGQIVSRSPGDKPYTVTEWNHCYPNRYAYEMPIVLASEATRRKWSGVFQFALSHNLDFFSHDKGINSYFDTILNPQQSLLMFPSSLIFYHPEAPVKTVLDNGIFTLESPFVQGAEGFIKNQPFSFPSFSLRSGQDGAVFLSSLENRSIDESKRLLLVTVSEVKNSGSGWGKDGFRWGRAPVLLKRMDVTVYFPQDKTIHVFALDEKGSRKKRIPARKKDSKVFFSTKTASSPWFEISRR